MSEIPFFFPGEERRLFGIHHQGHVLDHGRLAWVFCHPFAEEKLWSHRVYVSMARELARRGMSVLRFDYRGYGDSEGDFEEGTLPGHVADIQAAVRELQRRDAQVAHVGLLGLRYGATLALLAAAENPVVDHLILWDPVVETEQYLQEQLRSNLTTQMILHGKVVTNRETLVAEIRNGGVVNIDGYGLTNPYFDQVCGLRPLEIAKSYRGRTQIVEIGRQSQAPRKDIQALVGALAGAEHRRLEELQFWKEIKPFVRHSPALAGAALEWLGGRDA